MKIFETGEELIDRITHLFKTKKPSKCKIETINPGGRR